MSKQERADRQETADRLVEELEKISQDPKALEEAEEFNKKITAITPEELQREFTI